MVELLASLASAFGLGILAAVSPCPLATNIAAISFVARRMSTPRKVLISGLLYTLGRTLTYLALGTILAASLLSASDLSQLLQGLMNKLLGPILVLVGMLLLDLIRFRVSGPGVTDRTRERVEAMGLWGALLLGIVFAAAMCPIVAALFFGGVLPIALKARSAVLVPAVFGVATGVPVLVFALLIAGGAKSMGNVFRKVQSFERWARIGTGILFIAVGVYYSLRHIFGVLT